MNGATIPTMGVSQPATAANANAVFSNVAGVNSQRISTVSEKLAMYAQCHTPENATFFFNLCISLSRGVDFAIANNTIPDQVSSLPRVCKLVCNRSKDCNLQAAIMVLMVTMKHACNAHWFSPKETQEVLALAEEVARIFNTREGVSSEQTNINPVVSQIMSRYYPRIRLGHILACVEIQPGFEACAVDFHISKNMSPMTERKIHMLVTTRDNIETSSCIITPQKVNFMLNGKGVPGRMVGNMELGPQLPTVVTNMLRFGTNLLQAIGNFDAHYIVLIAFMGDVASSFLPVPEDYAQPASVSDAEVVEGPSRISLNCPITFSRMKTAAKGKLCKHLQCFDLSNFLEINSRCPSWKCPHCNQPICYPDLRIDKKMSKILQEAAESVVTVIIHTNGSWEAVSGNDDHKDEPIAKSTEALQENSIQPAASGLPNETCNVYDLTEGDDDMIIDLDMPEDTKPIIQSDPLNTSPYMSHFTPSAAVNPFDTIQQNINSGVYETLSSHFGPRTNIQPAGGSSAPMPGHFTPPVLTDSVSLASRQTQQSLVPSATKPMHLQQAPRPQVASSAYGGHPRPLMSTRPATGGSSGHTPARNGGLSGNRPVMNGLSGNRPVMNGLSRDTSSLPSRTSVNPSIPSNGNALRRDSVQQQQILSPRLELSNQSTAQMRVSSPILNNISRPTANPQTLNQPRSSTQISSSSLQPTPASTPQDANQPRPTNPSQIPNNAFRSTSTPQAPNQPRSTAPNQNPNNTFRPTTTPQTPTQPRPTNTNQNPNNAFRPTTTPQTPTQPRPTTPNQNPNNAFRPTSTPQTPNPQPLPIPPLQVNAVRPSSTPQPTNQTQATSDTFPNMRSAPPHLRARTQTQPRAPINPQYRTLTPPLAPTTQQRQLPTHPIQMHTSNSRPNPASAPSSAPPGSRPVQSVSRMQDLVDVQPDQNWQPSGRMRGSLSGRALAENLSQFVIRPTQQTTPNQVSSTPSPLQALIGNQNLHAASSQPNPPSQNNNN